MSVNMNEYWFRACREIIDRCVAPSMYPSARGMLDSAMRAATAADDKAGGEPLDTGDITGRAGLLTETGWDEWPEPKPKSATHGMNLGQRIAHVGGRITEKDTVEFGSVMAVKALVHHVLRDTHPQPQADVRVPDGYVLVPVKPTREMLMAGEIPTRDIDLGNGTKTLGFGLGASADSIYRRMLAAAPKPKDQS